MYKYDGLLVYQSHDDEGVLEIVEQDGVRSLHFGSYSRQSSIRLNDPHQLELDYVRAMTSWQLFKPTLHNDALLIGLGGGSLTKHLLHHFPHCRLKVVEYRQSVVKIARSHFALPLDPRLKIIIDDGGFYLRQRCDSHREQYELLLIDAFDHENMAQSLCNAEFFAACPAVLKTDGMLVINLWGGSHNTLFQRIAQWLRQSFAGRVLFLPVKDRGNVIGLAFNSDCPRWQFHQLRSRAIELEQLYNIDFPALLRDLKKNNASIFPKIVSV